jgi:hypothetical protein
MIENQKFDNFVKYLIVTVENIKVTRKSNYFLTIELEQNSKIHKPKNLLRTDVAIATKAPRFRHNSFHFLLSSRESFEMPLIITCNLFDITLYKDNSETHLLACLHVSLSSEQLKRLVVGETLEQRDLQLNSIGAHSSDKKTPLSDWKWFRRKTVLIVPSDHPFGTLCLSFRCISAVSELPIFLHCY